MVGDTDSTLTDRSSSDVAAMGLPVPSTNSPVSSTGTPASGVKPAMRTCTSSTSTSRPAKVRRAAPSRHPHGDAAGGAQAAAGLDVVVDLQRPVLDVGRGVVEGDRGNAVVAEHAVEHVVSSLPSLVTSSSSVVSSSGVRIALRTLTVTSLTSAGVVTSPATSSRGQLSSVSPPAAVVAGQGVGAGAGRRTVASRVAAIALVVVGWMRSIEISSRLRMRDGPQRTTSRGVGGHGEAPPRLSVLVTPVA